MVADQSSRKASGKKLTKEQKAQVLQMALQGTTPSEIARQMNVDVLRVSGTIRSARNSGQLPPDTPANPDPAPPPPAPLPATPRASRASAPAVPAPAATPAAVAAPPAPSGDGYAWSPTPGGGGFAHPAQTAKYLVERFAPQNDGLVGSHTSPPLDDEIAQKYGHGVYRVTKQVPGKMPEYRELNVSQAFGESRYPRAASPSQSPQRPGYPARPWQRLSPPRGDDEEGSEPPSMRPPFYPRRPVPYEERDRERTISEFARHSAHGAESVAVTVVDKLSSLQEKTLQRMEDQSRRGPDSFVRDFYQQQQDYQQRVTTEERRKDDERRDSERKREQDRQTAERKRDEDRRRDDEDRHRRWQTEQDERHRRDMERMKEERQTMLDLEDKKLNLIREESKAREDILRKEIENHRVRIEEIQEASEGRITEMQDSVKEDLERGRKTLEKEHEIRERALDNEHSLKQEMVNLKGEMIKSSGQDDLTKMLTTLVEGVKETIGKVVELKKFEMATPEDRAATMGQPPADVREIPAGSLPVSPTRPAQAAAPTPPKTPSGNGHGAQEGGGVAAVLNADAAIQENLKHPMAQYILREWSVTLRQGKDPAMFVNTFMEFMKDETPSGSEGRKACAAFAQLMDNRDWPEMKKLIGPALPDDIKPIFDAHGADVFYNAFRVMVCESVRDYWQMYLAEKQRLAQERQAAMQPQEPTTELAPPAPAEPPQEPAQEPVQEPAQEPAVEPEAQTAEPQEPEAEPAAQGADQGGPQGAA